MCKELCNHKKTKEVLELGRDALGDETSVCFVILQSIFVKHGGKAKIIVRHNKIYIEAWCARDVPLGLARATYGFIVALK